MADDDREISALDAAASLGGTELVPGVQSGNNRKITIDQIKTYAVSALGVDIKTKYGLVADGVTDNVPMFAQLRADYAGAGDDPVVFYWQAGDYHFATNQSLFHGIKNVVLFAYGVAVNWFSPGCAEQMDFGGYINTVSPGSRSVTFITPGEADNVTVGGMILVCGLDMQSGGQPQNFQFYEWHRVISADSNTGVVTFEKHLRHEYKSTWPHYVDAPPHNYGGPAAVYTTTEYWDITRKLYGLRFTTPDQQINCGGRRIEFHDCAFAGPGPAPTFAELIVLRNCSGDDVGLEIDKLISVLKVENCDFKQIHCQSPAPEMLEIDGCSLSYGIVGTAINTVIRNTFADRIYFGTNSFGASESVSLENVRANSISGTAAPVLFSVVTEAGGVFSKEDGSGLFHHALHQVVPSATYIMIDGTATSEHLPNYGSPFAVLDVTQDSSTPKNTIVTTTANDPLVKVYTGYGTADRFMPHPAPRVTAVNCVGTPDLVDLCRQDQDLPWRSYSGRTFVGAQAIPRMKLWGRLTKIRVKVVRAYTGAQSTATLNVCGASGVKVLNAVGTSTTYTPVINLEIAGERILTDSVVGAQSGDTLAVLPSGWCPESILPAVVEDMSGDLPSEWPIVEIEAWTDQGISKSLNKGAWSWTPVD